MKKKILVLGTCCMITLGMLTGCGGDTSNNTEQETSNQIAANNTNDADTNDSNTNDTDTHDAEESTNDSIIEFDNIILVDDETVTIELVNFYSEDVTWGSGTQNEKYITVRATNKTDHEIFLNPRKFYLNNEECYVSMKSGSIAPDPGKSGSYSFMVAYNTTPEHTALKSLEELKELEGSFGGLNKYDDGNNNTELEVSFSIPESLKNEN